MSQDKIPPKLPVGAIGMKTYASIDGGKTQVDITKFVELPKLLKAIYRDGATGSPRSMSKDVQTITDLVSKTNQEAPGGTTQQTNG